MILSYSCGGLLAGSSNAEANGDTSGASVARLSLLTGAGGTLPGNNVLSARYANWSADIPKSACHAVTSAVTRSLACDSSCAGNRRTSPDGSVTRNVPDACCAARCFWTKESPSM